MSTFSTSTSSSSTSTSTSTSTNTMSSCPPTNLAPQQTQQRGTLVPGQTITLKHYAVTVQRHISQGGFGHIYLVETQQPICGTTQHVLKHMHISDAVMLEEVQNEISVMRVLRSHPNIVSLTDSAILVRRDGSHEVFILMAYAEGGCIIDLMNRYIRERLSEQVVLQIFVDVCEAVAYMHSFSPPLLHRDIKVENVLAGADNTYMLCDFGSTACPVIRPPTTKSEIRAMEADINRHTTLQYRAPEMVDPYMRRPVDEKSDVWALGVMLYKLCYYATPFEGDSALPILSVKYTMPAYPLYSDNIKSLIASMLRDHGDARPTAAQVLQETHRIRGTQSRLACRQHQHHGLNIAMPRPVAVPVPVFRPDQKLVSSPMVCPPLPHHVTSMSKVFQNARSNTLPPIGIQMQRPPRPPQPSMSTPIPSGILSPNLTITRVRPNTYPVMIPPPTVTISTPTPTRPSGANYFPWVQSSQDPPPSIDQQKRRHHHMNQMTLNMIPPHIAPPGPTGMLSAPNPSSRSTSHLPVVDHPGHNHRYLPPPPSPLGSSSSSSSGSDSPRLSMSRQSSQSSAFGGPVRTLGRPLQV